jgi:hypothetical protein
MATFDFEPKLAVGEDMKPVAYAVGQVYAMADTSFTTPLSVTDLAGVPMGTTIQANERGVLPAIRTTDQPMVRWKSADFVLTWASMEGMRDQAVAASEDSHASRLAAETAAAAAALAAASSTIPPGGDTGNVLTRNEAGAAVWLAPSGGSGSGGGSVAWSNVSNKPTTFPPSAHTTSIADLRKGTDGATVLATWAQKFLAAGSGDTARAEIGAGTGNGTSDLTLGTLPGQAMPGTKTFKADEIRLSAAVPGLTAITTQGAVEELAGRPSGGGSVPSGILVLVFYNTVSGSWPNRPTDIPAGAHVIWAGPLDIGWPPTGGTKAQAGADFYWGLAA